MGGGRFSGRIYTYQAKAVRVLAELPPGALSRRTTTFFQGTRLSMSSSLVFKLQLGSFK